MIEIRPSRARGHADHGWLDTYHSFSFADYFDPRHMGFRALRVINEDRVAPGRGFGPHPHRDMEILTYVVSGRLRHEDSMGNGSVIGPGEVQYMSAGSGVVHSEMNDSDHEAVHLLQIWIETNEHAAKPRYGQVSHRERIRPGAVIELASPDGRDGSIAIRQDARMFALHPGRGSAVTLPLAKGRSGWLQCVAGNATANGVALGPGDGAALVGETSVRVESERAELLAFDLAD